MKSISRQRIVALKRYAMVMKYIPTIKSEEHDHINQVVEPLIKSLTAIYEKGSAKRGSVESIYKKSNISNVVQQISRTISQIEDKKETGFTRVHSYILLPLEISLDAMKELLGNWDRLDKTIWRTADDVSYEIERATNNIKSNLEKYNALPDW